MLVAVAFCAPAQDSVRVLGQFTQKGPFPASVNLRCAADESFSQAAKVNSYGAFTFVFKRTRPAFYIFETGNYSLGFPVNKTDSIYRLTVTGNADSVADITLDDSREFDAFLKLVQEVKGFSDALINLSHMCRGNAQCLNGSLELFKQVSANASSIAQKYPGTYTAQVLAPIFIFRLPASTDCNPAEMLDANMHAQLRLNNPAVYDNFFIDRLFNLSGAMRGNTTTDSLANYLTYLYACVNDSACTRRLSHMIYNNFVTYPGEIGLVCLNALATAGRVDMRDPVLAERLKNLSRSLAGNKAMDINLKSTKGTTISLLQRAAQARYTLLVFWSPNCHHCEMEMPYVKSLYDQYHAAGLNVYAVSIEGDMPTLQKYVAKKGWTWDNVLMPSDNPNEAFQYYVTQTPTLVLIDNNGFIKSRLRDINSLTRQLEYELGK